jgi:hypothetical protein
MMLAHPIERPGGIIEVARVRPFHPADCAGWPRGDDFDLRELAFKAFLPIEVALDLDLEDVAAIEAECRLISGKHPTTRPHGRPSLGIIAND